MRTNQLRKKYKQIARFIRRKKSSLVLRSNLSSNNVLLNRISGLIMSFLMNCLFLNSAALHLVLTSLYYILSTLFFFVRLFPLFLYVALLPPYIFIAFLSNCYECKCSWFDFLCSRLLSRNHESRILLYFNMKL
jgi:hypothetical protein